MDKEGCFTERVDRSDLTLPACLIIMDGYGLDANSDKNAVYLAETPTLDRLFKDCEWVKLQASGQSVGLPNMQMGNSEVGHLNIGAGRIVYQELTRINQACVDGTLNDNPIINEAFDNVKDNDGVLHLMGLLSDGGVHSSNEHLYALIEAAKEHGVKDVFIHIFLDGRDVPPSSGYRYIQELESFIEGQDASAASDPDFKVQIASMMGRYYSMDRDNRWDRVEHAFNTIVHGDDRIDLSPHAAIERSYEDGVTDEFVVPVSFIDRGIKSGDSLIFFNFRPDRAREITHAIVDRDFQKFDRGYVPDVHFVCLTEYDSSLDLPIAFPKSFPENVLADVLSDDGLSQYHIAETEKYAHVTFFLNGGVEEPKPGEKRNLIPSPKVATYDLQPEMSANTVTEELCDAIDDDSADVYIVNYANCDMVGHTGVIEAAVKAVETVDSGIERVLKSIKEKGGIAFITADHGNADDMRSEDGSPHTAHTTAPVPFILVNYSSKDLHLSGVDGKLADIAPTLLHAIGLEVPSEMTGEILLD